MAQKSGLFEERPHRIGNDAAFLAEDCASRHEYYVVPGVYLGYHKTDAFAHLSFYPVALDAAADLFRNRKSDFERPFRLYCVQNEIVV